MEPGDRENGFAGRHLAPKEVQAGPRVPSPNARILLLFHMYIRKLNIWQFQRNKSTEQAFSIGNTFHRTS
jgi:hypothetical protein